MNRSIPLLTVLMPAYQAEKYIKKSIDSVLKQSFSDFELLIIDDGSTDFTTKIVSSYTDPRIRLIQNPKNYGLIKTLNLGLELAQGKWIARLDSDDLATPTRFQKQIHLLEKDSSHLLCASQTLIIDENDKPLGGGKWNFSPEALYVNLFFRNCIAHSSVMFSKQSALQLGGYPLDALHVEDFALWHKLSLKGKAVFIPERLTYWREHTTSITTTKSHDMHKNSLAQAAKNLYNILSQNDALFLTESVIHPNPLERQNAHRAFDLFEKFSNHLTSYAPKHYSQTQLKRYLKVEKAMLFYLWGCPPAQLPLDIYNLIGYAYTLRRKSNPMIKKLGFLLSQSHL